MSEENNEKQSVVGAPTQPTEEDQVDVDSIVGELEQDVEAEEAEETDAPKSEQPAPAIDISKLTMEQLQELAARLNSTPSRAETETKKTFVKVRTYKGKLVMDFDNAYIGLVDDPENNRRVERHIIPILLEGEKEKIHIKYRDFMQLEQVSCEVIKSFEEDNSYTQGTTYNEHGELVQMRVKRVERQFNVLTPDGREVTIKGKIANA